MNATTGDYRVTMRLNGAEIIGKISVREDPMLSDR